MLSNITRNDVVAMAHHILNMDDEIHAMRRELEELREYRQLYNDELQRGIEHGQKMMGGILQMILTPGVTEALTANPKADSGSERG